MTGAVGRTVAEGRREDTRQVLAGKKCSTSHNFLYELMMMLLLYIFKKTHT